MNNSIDFNDNREQKGTIIESINDFFDSDHNDSDIDQGGNDIDDGGE